MKRSFVARLVALTLLAFTVILADARAAGINLCIPPTPTLPCISVDVVVEMYQNGKTTPDLSNGAYVVMTPPNSAPNQQSPFNVVVLGNDWNLYAIDLTGNWWKWTTWTQAWSNLNTTQTPSNIGLPGGTTTTPPPPPSTLIAEWLLTQASISGTTVADNSGNNNVGTVVNGPLTFATTPGATFNGSSQYVQSALVPKGSALTVGAWFNPASLTSGTGGNPRLVANSHTDVDSKGFQLMFNSGGGSGFFDVGNGTTEGRASWTQQLTKGTWYYYVGVYDGSTVSAYLNGVQVASKSFAGSAVAAGTGPNINVARNPSYGGDYYAGTLYDVQICQCALTAAQIQANYKAGP